MIEFTDKSGCPVKIKTVSPFGLSESQNQERALMRILAQVPASEFMTPPLLTNDLKA